MCDVKEKNMDEMLPTFTFAYYRKQSSKSKKQKNPDP